jgi:TRAP-type C4-dicarboxylate transport system substrate-binding protein
MAEAAIKSNKGNLVKEWTDGSTKIRFFDGAYAGKSPAELQQVRDRIDRTCRAIVASAQQEGKAVAV